MAQNSKSMGISLFGWYIIIFGLIKFYLVNAVQPPSDIIAGNVLSLSLLICGIGILRLKNFARLATITYFVANGAIAIIFYSYGLAETIANFRTPIKDPAGYTPVHTVIWIVVMLILLSVFYFLPPAFLCNSKIREQFK